MNTPAEPPYIGGYAPYPQRQPSDKRVISLISFIGSLLVGLLYLLLLVGAGIYVAVNGGEPDETFCMLLGLAIFVVMGVNVLVFVFGVIGCALERVRGTTWAIWGISISAFVLFVMMSVIIVGLLMDEGF